MVVFGAVNPWLHLTFHLSSEQSNIISIFVYQFLPCSSSGEAIILQGVDGKVALYKWLWHSSEEPAALLPILLPNSFEGEPSKLGCVGNQQTLL